MVKIRLKRIGKKNNAFYRVVAADSSVQRDGLYKDLIGTYNPNNGEVVIDNAKAQKWLKNGAQPTDTVRSLFRKKGIMKAFHESKQSTKKT